MSCWQNEVVHAHASPVICSLQSSVKALIDLAAQLAAVQTVACTHTQTTFCLWLCSMCFRFEEMVTALSQEPATTEEMDALEKYLNKTQQVQYEQKCFTHATLTA